MGKNCPRSCKNYFPRATTTYSRVTSHGVMLTSKVMADNETSSVISDSFSLESHEIDDDSSIEGESSEETKFNLQNTLCDVTTFKRSGARFAAFSQRAIPIRTELKITKNS